MAVFRWLKQKQQHDNSIRGQQTSRKQSTKQNGTEQHGKKEMRVNI